MKKTILAAICAAAIGATPLAAMAQATGQDSKMSSGAMKKSDGDTQGMSKDNMSKDGMKKDGMSKDSMKKDNNMMKKN
jgi:pentapeptide MXKDX repeat protein